MTLDDPAVIPFAFSIALNLVAVRDWFRKRREMRLAASNSRCARCGYDLRATTSGRCPECGEEVRPPDPNRRMVVYCSFCGNSSRDTGPCVEGPDGVFMCAACVDRAHQILTEARAQRDAPPPHDPA